jgi:hypothetical protein
MAASQNTRRKRKRSAPAVVRYKRSLTAGIKSLAESTWIKFTTGIVLLTSGLDEAVETLFSDISALELGAHHGVMVLGFVNILSSLPDMLDGLVGTFLADDYEDDDETGEEQRPDAIQPSHSAPPVAEVAELKKAA